MPISRKRQQQLGYPVGETVLLNGHTQSETEGIGLEPDDASKTPIGIRPYTFLGIDLIERSGEQAEGECPFCGKEKFTVEIRSGLSRCWSCGLNGTEKGGLNPIGFIDRYWRYCLDSNDTVSEFTQQLSSLARTKRLLSHESLTRWGVTVSGITGEYLAPGFDHKGKLHQLYRYAGYKEPDGSTHYSLMPTPGIWNKGKVHGLFCELDTLPLSSKVDTIYLCEGIWDAISLWEVLSTHKLIGRKKLKSSSRQLSELSHSVILATPGCKVFNEQWAELFSDRHLITLYDNDHPKKVGDNILEPDGMWGTRRVYVSCFSSRNVRSPSGFEYLSWGKDKGEEWSYNPDLSPGTDIRDVITEPNYEPDPPDDSLAQRAENTLGILKLLAEAPQDWTERAHKEKLSGKSFSPKACNDWETLRDSWARAILFRKELEDVLLCMLAVCVSTEQQGDQLFLQVIGDAGSAKTRLCDALVVSDKCYSLEHITGFHSGWRGKGGEDDDYSLLSRIDRKTLVTPEGDTMMSNPKYAEIMSQQRRIFDGTSGASFKHMKQDRRYTGLRTPWIIAGTPELMKSDQSRLGDRFLRIIIDRPDTDETDRILDKVAMTAFDSVRITTTPGPETTISPDQQRAYELTGGYINYLRDNAEVLIGRVAIDYQYMIECTKLLGKYTAFFRARPELDMRKDTETTKELPTRLTAQFSRLSVCLSAVLGKRLLGKESTQDVIRICRKVAEDTSSGRTKKLADVLYRTSRDKGLSMTSIRDVVGYSDEKTERLVRFLIEIEMLERFYRGTSTKSTSYYRLTDNVIQIMSRVRKLCQ